MKISDLIKEYGWSIFSDSDGSCACGSAYIGGYHIETHCHRTGRCNECNFSGVHIWSDNEFITNKKEMKEIAKLIKKYIEEAYMTDVNISYKAL